MKNILVVVGVLLVGSVSGILGSLFWSRALGRQLAISAVPENQQEQSASPQARHRLDSPRLAPLTSPSLAQEEALPTGKEPLSATPPPPVDRAAETERVKRFFSEKLAYHSAQPLDITWAKSTEGVLREGLLDAAKKAGFRTADISCRTTSCIANLEWDSYESMLTNLHTAVELGHNMTCARWAMAPDTPKDGGKVVVPLILDCTEWKNQGSVPTSARAR
jgi:hypothetical protein